MSTFAAVYLGGIIGAFIIFIVVLAFGQYQTRNFDGARFNGQHKLKDTPAKPTVPARWSDAA